MLLSLYVTFNYASLHFHLQLTIKNKLEINIIFSPFFSPFSNRSMQASRRVCNRRFVTGVGYFNHYVFSSANMHQFRLTPLENNTRHLRNQYRSLSTSRISFLNVNYTPPAFLNVFQNSLLRNNLWQTVFNYQVDLLY